MWKHLLLMVTAIVLINAELDIFENVLLPKAFLRWNLPNDFQKPFTVFEKKEMLRKLNKWHFYGKVQLDKDHDQEINTFT